VDSERASDTLITRLRATAALAEDDIRAIQSLPIANRRFRPNEPIIHDGDRPSECCLIVQGFCIRAKTTSLGKRQILSIHLPGEIPDLQSLHLHIMDHDLIAVSDCTIGTIGHAAMRRIIRQRPDVGDVFWRDTLVQAALFREWIVNVGQRPGPSRLAHLIVELRERLKVIGRVQGARFEMPFTQELLGEALGITPIHVNRLVKQLREENVLEFHRGYVTVIDEDKLIKLADFDHLYLHQSPAL
jgi:CRP-like cAMP-binding protein